MHRGLACVHYPINWSRHLAVCGLGQLSSGAHGGRLGGPLLLLEAAGWTNEVCSLTTSGNAAAPPPPPPGATAIRMRSWSFGRAADRAVRSPLRSLATWPSAPRPTRPRLPPPHLHALLRPWPRPLVQWPVRRAPWAGPQWRGRGSCQPQALSG